MTIRFAADKDITTLAQHDRHISAAELENSIKLRRIYIAECDGKFIGWLRYNLFWDNTPFMNMLYILKPQQSRGFGSKLVAFWEAEMKKQGYTTLMTSTVSSEYSQHFYNKLGYFAIGGFTLPGDLYEIILCKEI